MNNISPTLPPTTTSAQPVNDSMQKMRKVAERALTTRRNQDSFMNIERALPSLQALQKLERGIPQAAPLCLQHEVSSAQGTRKSMEDAHFIKEVGDYTLLGVLDGHSGVDVANFAAQDFQDKFMSLLENSNHDVRQAFRIWFDEVTKEVFKKKELDTKGCTAAISVVDKKRHLIYTATVGDTEANIYREGKSIPLSYLLTWGSPREAKRAADALDNPDIATNWPKRNNPKGLRFPPVVGLNVSRSIGDKQFATWLNGNPGVIHKPKISVNELKPGDTLVLACDGLKDVASEQEIIAQLGQENPAQTLVNFALNEKQSNDNVTVIVAKVG